MIFSQQDLSVLARNNPSLTAKYPELFLKKSKQPKYKNTKVYVCKNGFVSYGEKPAIHNDIDMVFDSTKEYDRWNELKLLEKAKCISNLSRQEKLIIQAKSKYQGKEINEIAYKADFCYNREDKRVIEDVKPFDRKTGKYRCTKDFNLKWKLLKLKYPQYLFEIF